MSLKDQVKDLLSSKERFTFSLESGRGETYRNRNPVLYAHSLYPESSVLAGRSRRIWIHSWHCWKEARNELKDLGLTYEDYGELGGTTYIPTSVLVRDLPETED